MFNQHRHPMHRRKKLLFVPVILLLFFGLSWLVQFLWNTILPEAVHAQPLDYWHAAGLLVLCKILFGSFGFKGRGGHGPNLGGPTRDMREKWMNMTDEQRVKFKEKLRDRCRRR